MRIAFLLVSILSLSACDFLGPQGVTEAAVTSVSVQELDLSQPWDNPFTNDKPDIYVDIFDSEGGIEFSPDFRSDVREDVDALPLSFPVREEYRVGLEASVRLNVSDRDGPGSDDQMFTTQSFLFSDFYNGEEQGAYTSIPFENEQGRVIVTVQWR